MIRFQNLPIRRKLAVGFLGTALVALVLACAAFVAYEQGTFRKNLVQNLTVMADALGSNSTGALTFDDVDEGRKTLSALKFDPDMVSGALYKETGALFARYAATESENSFPNSPAMDDKAHFEGDYVTVSRPIILDGKLIGMIYLKASLVKVRDRLRSYMIISGMVLLGALVLAFVLSSFFERIISRPILELAGTAQTVTEKDDYSVRAKKQGGDELGLLTDSFNQMLDDIQKRDATQLQTNAELREQVRARQEAEKQLQNMNELLEKRVEERTSELQRSNAELEQFAYVASHDLQEPLRMVSGYMQLIERRYKNRLDEEADRFIDFAVDGAKRMQALIQDLLSYSRVGTRGKVLEPIDCAKVLKGVLGNLELAITESGATVTHDAMPTVPGDATQLAQLFQNLVGNAIKFRSQTPPRIHVGARCRDDQWLFTVRDNGIGIEPQFFDRIFVIFQRLHTREQYPGTGIGLSVCRKIVERHGGRIWVESAPGNGTAFHFTIPTAPAN